MSDPRKRVGIIFGGRSSEHDVSILSAKSVISAMDPNKYLAIPIHITKQGTWHSACITQLDLPGEAIVLLPGQTTPYRLQSLKKGLNNPIDQTLDIIFPLIHGPFGEDGTLQGLLEMSGIPYVGSGVLSSALGMDKALMKAIFLHHGLPVVQHQVVSRNTWQNHPQRVQATCLAELPLPWFVKPANMGSSVGITKVKQISEFAKAMDHAALFDRKILVEAGVSDAREIEIAILGNEEPQLSVLGEIITHFEFYDYHAKYLDESLQLIVPAKVHASTLQTIHEIALKAFFAIDCAGIARVDFLVRRTDNAVFLSEINTMPGFTNVSMYPKLWQASGLAYPDLIDKLLNLGLQYHADKQCNRLLIPV